jgi:hypothetical protein
MRHHTPRRNPAHLDRILEGQSTTPDPLNQFVSALRAPGHHTETAGLDAALTAFADPASAANSPMTQRRPSMLKSLAGKVLAAKVIAITASAAAVGGVAYAASTGNLPAPLEHSSHAAAAAHTHVPTAVPADPSTSDKAAKSPNSAASSKASLATRSASATAKHHSASPSPSLVGLCHAWLARPAGSGKADESPAFTYLINTAGGKSSVTSWCTKLLASGQHPAQGNKPSDNPGNGNGKPSSHPTGKPSAHPTGQPSSHPTGRPTDAPSKTKSTGNPGSSHNQH